MCRKRSSAVKESFQPGIIYHRVTFLSLYPQRRRAVHKRMAGAGRSKRKVHVPPHRPLLEAMEPRIICMGGGELKPGRTKRIRITSSLRETGWLARVSGCWALPRIYSSWNNLNSFKYTDGSASHGDEIVLCQRKRLLAFYIRTRTEHGLSMIYYLCWKLALMFSCVKRFDVDK